MVLDNDSPASWGESDAADVLTSTTDSAFASACTTALKGSRASAETCGRSCDFVRSRHSATCFHVSDTVAAAWAFAGPGSAVPFGAASPLVDAVTVKSASLDEPASSGAQK